MVEKLHAYNNDEDCVRVSVLCCTYVCICVCVMSVLCMYETRKRTYTYARAHTYTRMHTRTPMHMLCVYVCACVRIYVRMCMCECVYDISYRRTPKHVHTIMHTHTTILNMHTEHRPQLDMRLFTQNFILNQVGSTSLFSVFTFF